MQIYDFTIKAGGTAPPLKIGIENENNSVVDFSAHFVGYYLPQRIVEHKNTE